MTLTAANTLITLSVENINASRSTVKVRVDPASVSGSLQRTRKYKSIPERLRPALEKMADYIRTEMITRTFDQEGPGWAHLSRRTINERLAQGYPGPHPILKRSGDLLHELTDKSHPKHIEIIKIGKYARIEVGGSSDKFIQNQLGDHSLHLPARPMIPGTGNHPIDARDRIHMTNILRTVAKEMFHD